jgi:hypothetical protein
MTAYRKFKLPEAAGSPAKVANLAKVRTSELETLATLATLAAGNAQTMNLGGKPNDGAPPDPDEAELEEREGMAIGGAPEPYLNRSLSFLATDRSSRLATIRRRVTSRCAFF